MRSGILRAIAAALVLALGCGSAALAADRPPVITFYFGLKRPEASARSAFFAVQQPGAPSYRRFLSVSQVSARFGASPATRSAFVRALAAARTVRADRPLRRVRTGERNGRAARSCVQGAHPAAVRQRSQRQRLFPEGQRPPRASGRRAAARAGCRADVRALRGAHGPAGRGGRRRRAPGPLGEPGPGLAVVRRPRRPGRSVSVRSAAHTGSTASAAAPAPPSRSSISARAPPARTSPTTHGASAIRGSGRAFCSAMGRRARSVRGPSSRKRISPWSGGSLQGFDR